MDKKLQLFKKNFVIKLKYTNIKSGAECRIYVLKVSFLFEANVATLEVDAKIFIKCCIGLNNML